MTIDFEGDLDEIFSTDDHGVTFTYSGSSYSGIFNMEFISQDGGTVGIESAEPILYTKTDNVSGAEHGETITISGVDYTIVGIQPDGTGITVLVLNG